MLTGLRKKILNIVFNTQYYLPSSHLSIPTCTILSQLFLMFLFQYLEHAMLPPEIETYGFSPHNLPTPPFPVTSLQPPKFSSVSTSFYL
jgi:hypothetical protein